MSDTSAAIKAAKDIQADTIAPELYRQATEYWRRARREYRYKNFDLAHEYAAKARKLAEDAEFESIKSGGVRADPVTDAPPPPQTPYDYPKNPGVPADSVKGAAPTGTAPTPTTP